MRSERPGHADSSVCVSAGFARFAEHNPFKVVNLEGYGKFLLQCKSAREVYLMRKSTFALMASNPPMASFLFAFCCFSVAREDQYSPLRALPRGSKAKRPTRELRKEVTVGSVVRNFIPAFEKCLESFFLRSGTAVVSPSSQLLLFCGGFCCIAGGGV